MSDSFQAAVARSAEIERRIGTDPGEFRMLTGDRPTGALHIGHYFGSIQNRIRLQRSGVEIFQLIADYQVITDRESVGDIGGNVRSLLLDNIAAGLDPDRATFFTHSAVPALNQLLLPFLSLVSVAELQRNPTVKEEAATAGIKSINGLMLTYPVHQAADILFCKANVVPVGKDQLPHLELARVIARRFNRRYSPAAPYFPEPAALLTDAPALLGTDAQKMSKSRGNAIPIGATAEETARLVAGAKTDAERRIAYDPVRRPGVSNLVLLGALCLGRTPEDVAAEVGDAGGAALKRLVTEAINERFRGIRARRAELLGDRAYLR
ncbi:tryptophan--tRNA ligase, partial [Nocardioides sp.]|uniref:tryptophan--tRNA ligase n=1 Tax=Nocardioides sp. TaxID=35761 RepID=UPI002ED0FD4E